MNVFEEVLLESEDKPIYANNYELSPMKDKSYDAAGVGKKGQGPNICTLI